MERVRRPRISTAEKTEVWTRWKRGESLSDIGRAVDRVPGTIFHVLAARGGVSPTRRTRSWLALTLTEREEISRGLARGCSLRGISASLGRAPSTISREVRRHGGLARYRASVADARTWRRAHRPKPCRLATSAPRRALVATKLAAAWSPQQIAGWLKRTFPDHPHMQVSHRLLEQAGLRKIRLHDLRHTYASLLIQQGESLAYVQQQLGHSSVQVTVDVYGHLIPGANRAAVDRLDAQPPRNPAATSANPGRTRKALSGCKNWSRCADSNRGPTDDESAQPASSGVQGRPFLREFRLVYWVIVRRRPAPSTRVALRLALSSWRRSSVHSSAFIRCAASVWRLGSTCASVFMVRLICEWPRISITTRGLTPWASRTLAHECRRS